jgi:site-specific DNA-methyltransferase (adenine-specific)
MSTIFFRFLVSLRKITQDNKADVFAFVPDLPTDRLWTDDALCERYGLTHEERDFMRSLIREMTFAG